MLSFLRSARSASTRLFIALFFTPKKNAFSRKNITAFASSTFSLLNAKRWMYFSWYFSAQSLKMNQPEFLTPLRNHTVEVGKNVTFECYVTGIEKYKVSIFLLSFKISHASRLSLHKRGVVLKKDSMTPPFPSKKLKEAVFHGVFGLGC